MNKSTKLEGLYDKIDVNKMRFEVLKKEDIKINIMKKHLKMKTVNLLNQKCKVK